MARNTKSTVSVAAPMLKTIEQMSIASGIGQTRLREMVERKEIEHIRIGNRILIADRAIWNWYEQNRVMPNAERIL